MNPYTNQDDEYTGVPGASSNQYPQYRYQQVAQAAAPGQTYQYASYPSYEYYSATAPAPTPTAYSYAPQPSYDQLTMSELWMPPVSTAYGAHQYPAEHPQTQMSYTSTATPAEHQPSTSTTANTISSSSGRMRLSHDSRTLLDNWFHAHRDNPYIEKDEAERLAGLTGLSIRQIRTYFANSRARKLPPSRLTSTSPDITKVTRVSQSRSVSMDTASVPTPPHASSSSSLSTRSRQPVTIQPLARRPTTTHKNPLERYLSSSPEDEGLDEAAVRHAAARARARPVAASAGYASTTATASSSRYTSHHARNPSYDAPASSSSSSPSPSIVDTSSTRGPRRGRRRASVLTRHSSVVRSVQDPQKIYQCTFCSRDFGHKYDWRRHEESVHYPQEEWVCMPDNTPVVRGASNGYRHCAFCNQHNPGDDHLSSRHNCMACLDLPLHQRLFTRKDKLLQHIGQVHKSSNPSSHVSEWRRPVQRRATFRCGICGVEMRSWADRIEHIAAHFAAGQDMRFWLGDAGQIMAAASSDDARGSGGGGGVSSSSATTRRPGRGSLSSSSGGGSHATSSQRIAPSQLDVHPCPANCRRLFPSFIDAVFHERQHHGIYKERLVPQAPPPLPPPSGAGMGMSGYSYGSGSGAAVQRGYSQQHQQQQHQHQHQPHGSDASGDWMGGNPQAWQGYVRMQ